MKKIVCIIILVCLFLVSCQKGSTNDDQAPFTNLPEGILNDVPPTNSTIYHFDSYEELKNILLSKNSDQIQEEKALYGAKYEIFLDHISNADNVKIPNLNGEELPLREKEGFSHISLMTYDFLALPWIWYHCVYGDNSVTVKITYPELFLNQDLTGKSAHEILKLINEKAVSVDNYTEFENYEKAYLKDIELKNATVSAVVYEIKNSDKIFIKFYYNDVFVSIDDRNGALTEEFWKNFDLS